MKFNSVYIVIIPFWPGHSNEWNWAVLSCGAVQGGSNFESVDEILKCDHSNESYWAVLSCGAVYHAVQGNSNFLCLWLKS